MCGDEPSLRLWLRFEVPRIEERLSELFHFAVVLTHFTFA